MYLSALDGCNNHRQESSFINDDFTNNSYNDSINLRNKNFKTEKPVCQVHFCTLHEEGTQRFVNVDLFGLKNTEQYVEVIIDLGSDCSPTVEDELEKNAIFRSKAILLQTMHELNFSKDEMAKVIMQYIIPRYKGVDSTI